jgi:hypothetical protein
VTADRIKPVQEARYRTWLRRSCLARHRPAILDSGLYHIQNYRIVQYDNSGALSHASEGLAESLTNRSYEVLKMLSFVCGRCSCGSRCSRVNLLLGLLEGDMLSSRNTDCTNHAG